MVDVLLCPQGLTTCVLHTPQVTLIPALHFIRKGGFIISLLAVGQATLALHSKWSHPHGCIQWWWWKLLSVTSNHTSSSCAACCLTGKTLMGDQWQHPSGYVCLWPIPVRLLSILSHLLLPDWASWSLQTAYHCSYWHVDPYRYGYYAALKCQDLTVQWHSTMTQRNRIFHRAKAVRRFYERWIWYNKVSIRFWNMNWFHDVKILSV